MTINEIADKMGVHKNTLGAWKRRFGCPTDSFENAEAWRLKNRPDSYQQSADRKAQSTADSVELKRQKLEQEVRNGKLVEKLKQIEIDKAMKVLIPSDEIAGTVAGITEEVKATLQFKLEDQLPVLLEGKSIAEIRAICSQVFLEILSRWQAFGRRNGVKM